MKATKVSAETLHAAAEEIGVTLNITSLSQRGTSHRVKLLPLTPDSLYRPTTASRPYRSRRWPGERGDARYQRTSVSLMFHEGRRVHAVCWHGFRDFFRAVYRREPGAIFYTSMATWRGRDHFEANFRQTGHKNIGSQMAPCAAAEACRCPDSGYVDARNILDYGTSSYSVTTFDTYGADEADGAACRAMANALRAAGKEG